MGTSLEILILALVEQGLATPYDLRRAGLSVGAAHPALQRLVKRKLLVKGKAGTRGRSEYQLTKAGRDALRSWADLLRAYMNDPPADVESVLRLAALGWTGKAQADALSLLEQAAAQWRPAGPVPRPPAKSSDLAVVYSWMLSHLERERREADTRTLRSCSSFLKRSRGSRKRR